MPLATLNPPPAPPNITDVMLNEVLLDPRVRTEIAYIAAQAVEQYMTELASAAAAASRTAGKAPARRRVRKGKQD